MFQNHYIPLIHHQSYVRNCYNTFNKQFNHISNEKDTKINNKLYTHKDSNIIGIELDNEGDDDIENEEITNEEPSGEDSSKFSSKEESSEESAEDSDDEFGKESNGDYSSEEFSEADKELNEETDESQCIYKIFTFFLKKKKIVTHFFIKIGYLNTETPRTICVNTI